MMAYRQPKIFLWMMEQDRERAQALRALERAARSGGEDRPGLARGGIVQLRQALRRATLATQLASRPFRPDLSSDRLVGGLKPVWPLRSRASLPARESLEPPWPWLFEARFPVRRATAGAYHPGHGPAPVQPGLRRPLE